MHSPMSHGIHGLRCLVVVLCIDVAAGCACDCPPGAPCPSPCAQCAHVPATRQCKTHCGYGLSCKYPLREIGKDRYGCWGHVRCEVVHGGGIGFCSRR